MLENDNVPAAGLNQNAGGIASLVAFALAFLKRQYLVILACAALAIAACMLYLEITPPTYSAQAQILLAHPPQLAQQQAGAPPPLDLNQIDTQIQILKSRAIAVAVIKQLNLQDDPEFSDVGLWRRIRTTLFPRPEDRQAPLEGPPDDVINAFQEQLSANRVDFSNVIEITFNSSSAKRAAEIANATAKAYIDDQINAKSEANRLATNWLQDRLRDLGDEALKAERAVSTYKSQNNIVSPGGRPIDEVQVAELNTRLMAARAQTSDVLAKLKRYEAILSANAASSAAIGTLDAAGTDAVNNQIINNLRQQYLELKRSESEWSARYGENHFGVLNIRSRMRDLRTSILDEVRRLAESTRGELHLAKLRQEEIEKQLAAAISQSRSTDSAEMTIRSLDDKAKALRRMYDTFLQRYMGSMQQQTLPVTETRVLSPASPPQRKSKPKNKKILLMGVLGGLGLGIAVGSLREVMDRGFRTSGQVERVLYQPCLSLVPYLPGLEQETSPVQTDEDVKRRLISTASAIHRAITDMPLSRFAEAIRSIKLAIDLSPNEAANRVIGITSALPYEGKTTIAAMLAEAIAHSGKKIILLDGDLRNPTLSAALAPRAGMGIIEVINGDQSIEETVWRDPKTNLAFLPTVRREPLIHITEFLCAEAMRKLFDQLRETYDYIIVDLPPLAPVVDVRATAPLLDGLILVVEWGRSKVEVVQHALRGVPSIYRNMIGTVLNKTDMKAMIRYDIHQSDYYSDKYDARYGFSGAKERV